jgi:adenylate cyclase
MAYPPSRHMAFRIGITIGDVVERDGDLLGDGVNIAARLEGLAEVGGICVSRAVHEQVVNKLSVQFADIGAQEVKNIPTPVHAYMIAMRREDGTYATPQVKKPQAKAAPARAPHWLWPVVVGVVSVVAICVAGFLYFTKLELGPSATKQTASLESVEKAVASSAPSIPSPTPTRFADAAPPSPAPTSPPAGGKFAAETVPFVTDKIRAILANEYVAAAEPKAFALNFNGMIGLSSSEPNEEAAKSAALELCQKRADSVNSPRKCELYAVNSTVVYPHGRPPLPPLPWIRRDPSTERPFASKDLPFARERGRERLEGNYVPGKKSKAIALGPGGNFIFYTDGATVGEVVRRTLETCGALAGTPCMIVAIDDAFVVPVPTIMTPTGFFKAADNSSIEASAREGVAQQLAEASSGWNAVAVGTTGHAGVAVKAASEQNAINDALGNCAKRDSDCHVIAIGPFVVAPHH